jgi:hypothetical protein
VAPTREALRWLSSERQRAYRNRSERLVVSIRPQAAYSTY